MKDVKGVKGVKTSRRSATLAESWSFAALLLVAGIWAYGNSFTGAFMGDDLDAIVRNPNVRTLWPPQVPLTAPNDTTLAGRPVASLSFAINYAFQPPAPHRGTA